VTLIDWPTPSFTSDDRTSRLSQSGSCLFRAAAAALECGALRRFPIPSRTCLVGDALWRMHTCPPPFPHLPLSAKLRCRSRATRNGKRCRAPHSKASLRAAVGLWFRRMATDHWPASVPHVAACCRSNVSQKSSNTLTRSVSKLSTTLWKLDRAYVLNQFCEHQGYSWASSTTL